MPIGFSFKNQVGVIPQAAPGWLGELQRIFVFEILVELVAKS